MLPRYPLEFFHAWRDGITLKCQAKVPRPLM